MGIKNTWNREFSLDSLTGNIIQDIELHVRMNLKIMTILLETPIQVSGV